MDEYTEPIGGNEPENRGIEQESGEAIVISEEPIERRKRGRPRKRIESSVAASADGERKTEAAAQTGPRRKKAAAAKKAGSGGEELASLVVELANLLAQTVAGSDAVMTPFERGMIEPALGNILSRTSDEALTRFLGVSDFIMLAVGSGLWLSRVSKMSKKEETEPPSKPIEEEKTPVADELGKIDLPLGDEGELWHLKLG